MKRNVVLEAQILKAIEVLGEATEPEIITAKHSKEATKEHKEHPWATWEVAEKIAADHKRKRK